VSGGPRWRAALLSTPGPDRVLVAVSLQRADATARQVRVTVLVAAAVIVLVLGLSAWWVARLGLRPIAEVTEVADAIAAGDRSRRVVVSERRTEAGHLGRAFNVMLDEQRANEDRLRRFIADASHELRTPVAAIRGFADLYRAGGLDEPGVLADAMRRIGGESVRMAGLVEDLLLLARLDEGRPLEARPVDLSAVLRDAAFDTSATHPNRLVRAEVVDDLTVVGDDARLRQVVANVVHNALTHGGPDATVTVRGRRQGDLCVVEVADDGAGMEPQQASHAFDRFWRADQARTRHANGAGLGLSIVRAITEAHGGRVALDSAPGHGTTVRVVLPAA
jgi:two-component system OmpR family sensor kinase